MAEPNENLVVIEQVAEQAATVVEQVEQATTMVDQAATVVEQVATVTNMGEHNVTTEDDQLEAERKGLEKTAKQLGGVSLGINIVVIVAAIANKNQLGSISRGELILLRTSAVFALVSFLAWATLLIFIQLKKIEKHILRGSIIIGIFSIAIGVMLLGLNIMV